MVRPRLIGRERELRVHRRDRAGADRGPQRSAGDRRRGRHRQDPPARAAVRAGRRVALPPASVRAHHVEASARPGDEEAVALLSSAGESVAVSAPASAARWLSAAVRLLPEGDRARRLELLPTLAVALGQAGDLEAAREALLDALVLMPTAAPRRAQLTAFLAAIEHLLGRHEEAHRRLEGALEELPDRRSREGAALMIELAADAVYGMDHAAVALWSAAAREAAARVGDPPLRAAAAGNLAMSCHVASAIAPAQVSADEGAAWISRLSDDQLAARVDAPYYLGWGEYFLDRLDAAIEHLGRGIAVARATGQAQFLVQMLGGKVMALTARGRLDEAVDMADGAVQSARLSGNQQALSWALWEHGWALLAQGEVQAAVSLGEEATGDAAEAADAALASAASADQPGARVDAARARTLAGRALYAAGQRREAVPELERAGARSPTAAHAAITTRPRSSFGGWVGAGRGGGAGRSPPGASPA